MLTAILFSNDFIADSFYSLFLWLIFSISAFNEIQFLSGNFVNYFLFSFFIIFIKLNQMKKSLQNVLKIFKQSFE
jgi:hypothetical protein